MVLSLVDLSLRSIRKGIADGTIQHPHLLPPKLRQRVFDTAFKQGLADHPNFLEILTSVELLTGLTSISANARNDNDLEFLKRLVVSLATKLPNGQTVGAAVKKLNLKIYDYGVDGSHFENEKTYSEIISKVSDLIGHCPNTKSMDLRMRKSNEGFWPLNENENSARNRVMENLTDLSVVLSDWKGIIERPIINFKKLTTLKLEYCSFTNGTWPKLVEKIPLVENLHFFEVSSNENGLDWILPSPLAHLKSLEVFGCWQFFKCNKAFIDKLMECKQLRQVRLKLDEKSTDEESLIRLANMDIDLKIKIRLLLRGRDTPENDPVFDSSSRGFKIVSICHKRMESFELNVPDNWNPHFSTALEDVVNTCSNLTSFGITKHPFRVNQSQIDFEESKRVNAALVRFFSNPRRAQQLEGCRLNGNFDETVLSAAFENCLNLIRLDITDCPTLRDQHLIDWVARGGGKLTDLVVLECNNVTSEGIIPVLARSAQGLLCYCIRLNQDNSGRNWKTAVRNHCPNAVVNVYERYF